jgi:polysaccharide export outer membrane protein
VNSQIKHAERRRRWLGLLAICFVCATGLGAAPASAQPEYFLAPGDILKISVFKNADLSLDVRVSESGAIGYPLIGSVPVKGLTLPAAEGKIAQMLRDGGFVVNPQVNILLTEGFGNLVSVIGEVNKSGRYSVDAAGGHVSCATASLFDAMSI